MLFGLPNHLGVLCNKPASTIRSLYASHVQRVLYGLGDIQYHILHFFNEEEDYQHTKHHMQATWSVL
jgi:hypothetical protein